jgi:hypothetical protein
MPQTTTTQVNGAAAGILVTFSVIMLVVWVIQIVSYWKVFAKAGHPGWKAIIPIYNAVILTKIAKYSGWYALLLFVPLVNFVWLFILNIDIAKAFRKSTGFGVLMTLLPIIGYPILGFGDATYDATPKAQ